jgi:probable F420-dependent oxidoreductase
MLAAVKVRIAVAPGGAETERVGLAALVDGLEQRGFDTVWLSDVPLAPTVDPLVGLAFAAGRTERLKLGANVVPIGRNPMLLAKELAQLDRLSDGRLLLSFVPGIDQPGERAALGSTGQDRGRILEETIRLLRRWWAGETVEHRSERWEFPGIAVRPLPVQRPLEVWLGGIGPKALDRVGRIGVGWLGAALSPTEAAAARARIDAAAADAGRVVDPEHHGLSIPYARSEPDPATHHRAPGASARRRSGRSPPRRSHRAARPRAAAHRRRAVEVRRAPDDRRVVGRRARLAGRRPARPPDLRRHLTLPSREGVEVGP